jgi:ATP-dependent exoDNAse (exonuclease V) beta subunit
VPSVADGWTRCELTANCRNTFQIASLLRQRFDGALAPVGGPESEDLRFIEFDSPDDDAISDAVGEALDLLEGRDHAAESILVATFTGSVRDLLIDDLGFARWEDRDPMAILCENVHRVKGLEFDHVILVVHDAAVSDKLLYVGASRAIMSLTVIGSAHVRVRLGSEASSVSRP